jgi:hypothetical protein
MAKSKTTIKTLERRIAKMSSPKRKRRTKRRHTTAMATHHRKPIHHRRRRRKKGFLHDSTTGLMHKVKQSSAGALGGVAYTAIEMLPFKPWMKIASGFIGSILASSFLNSPNVGAGLAGATAYNASKVLFPSLLHDMENVHYVDPNTLCDSGYVDSQGNAIVQDHDGVMYQLNDHGDLVAVGDAYQLNDAHGLSSPYQLNDDYRSVSMVPLSDPYALNDRFDIN